MDLFSTATLSAIVADLRLPKLGLAARYFNNVDESETEHINFDVNNKPRRMAPFVSPLVAGKVVQGNGFRTDTFKPAYIKDKRVFNPGRTLKRAIGERIGGGDVSPADRMQILLVNDMQDQLEMLERRMEWMAAKTLLDGAVTVVGEDYPAAVVNFGRAANQTVVKTSGNYWGEASIDPLDDLQDWSDRMVKAAGVGITDVIMTVDVWKVFRKNPNVKERLDLQRVISSLQPNAHKDEGLQFQGMVDNFAIWTYSGWAVDPVSGVETAYLPAGTVICTADPSQVEGTRHHGAIQDVDVLQAMAYFTKSWVEQDPSMRYLMMQTAPLLVPYRVNATLRATVLGA